MKTIGIIGPGKHFSQKIYPVLKNSNFFKISGILRKRNLDFKNVRKFNERQFFLNNFDFVYIASPNKSHEKYIIKSLNSGFNVICEKPFVISKKNINKRNILKLINQLKNINIRLWNVEDKLRVFEKNKLFKSEFISLARKVYFMNDKRAYLKNEINIRTKSQINEVKSYEEY